MSIFPSFEWLRHTSGSMLPKVANQLVVGGRFETWLGNIARERPLQSKRPDWQTITQHPASQRWQENTRGPWTYPGDNETWLVELARFAVSYGEVGIVRSLQQWISTNFDMNSPFDLGVNDQARWFLRLESNPVDPNQYAQILSGRLPGNPYQRLPEIVGIWYPPHVFPNLALLVPGGYTLRLFVQTYPALIVEIDPPVYAGRLAGFTMSENSMSALDAVRRGE